MTDLLPVIERFLNGLVAADESLAAEVRALDDSSVRLECLSPEFSLVLSAVDGRLTLARDTDRVPDVTIAGTAREFAEFARAKRAGRPTPSGVVRISGDLAVAEKVQNLVRDFGIDWESLVARVIGDVPTHHTMRAARGSGRFLKARLLDVGLDVAEYLKYEHGLVAGAEDIEAFADGVRDVRAAVDRLEARIALAEARAGREG